MTPHLALHLASLKRVEMDVVCGCTQSKGLGDQAARYKCSIHQPHPNTNRRKRLCKSIIFKMLTRISKVD